MMVRQGIFDNEVSHRVLVNHAFIIAGGDITKRVCNWIGNELNVSKRLRVMFMDRDDTLNQFAVDNLLLSKGALPALTLDRDDLDNDVPF